MSHDHLNPAEFAAIKTLLGADIEVSPEDASWNALAENGCVRIVDGRVAITIKGYRKYLEALPGTFLD